MRRKKEYKAFPRISSNNWFLVREQFKKSLPRIVTAESLSPYIEIKDLNSINCNVIVALKRMGLLNESGIPTKLAERWRIDREYSKVCREIVSAVYPEELISIAANRDNPRHDTESWFIENGFGSESARTLARVLLLLLDENIYSNNYRKKNKNTKMQKMESDKNKHLKTDNLEASKTVQDFASPTVHIDLQIHISSDSSPEQIDAIFSSMAKHIYSLSND